MDEYRGLMNSLFNVHIDSHMFNVHIDSNERQKKNRVSGLVSISLIFMNINDVVIDF